MDGFKDLRKGVQVNRNRDMSWVRTLDKNPLNAAWASGCNCPKAAMGCN